MGSAAEQRTVSANALDYALTLLTVIVWGGSFAATKYAIGGAGPILTIFMRFVLSIPVLWLGMKFEKCARFPTKKEFWPLLLMGFQGILFHQGIQSYALQTAGAANSNWLFAATPTIVALFGWIFLKEKLSHLNMAGLALATLGIFTVMGFGTVKPPSSGCLLFGVGDLLMLLSFFNWAAFLIITRKILSADLSPSFVLFWEILFAAILCIPAALFLGCDFSRVWSFAPQTWGALIFLGVFASALGYFFWFHALSVLPVARVVVFQFIQPLAGAAIAYLLVGERYTIWLFAGGAMIICGVCMVNRKG